MSTTNFKLSRPSGLTRRISFPVKPSWQNLSLKISSLYSFAVENVGVSYVDNDGDEVTLSSEEELQDFYRSSHQHHELIKFTVQDLGASRSSDEVSPRARSATPQQSNFRNTFGGHEALPMVFEVEDEWQRLHGDFGRMFMPRPGSESPHAFVEVLESDISGSKGSNHDDDSVADRSLMSDLIFTNREDKGKGKAHSSMQASVSDDVSSTGSVIADELPSKPPVHVFDMNDDGIFGNTKSSTPPSGTVTPAQAESTPVISSQIPLAPQEKDFNGKKLEAESSESAPDPPLPDLPPAASNVSLSNDIATVLNTMSAVVALHPELSEGIRNVVNNATNGTYWSAHREALSRAAGDFHRTAAVETGRAFEDIRNSTEQEAGARVAEAIGRVMRAFGETLANTGSGSNPPEQPQGAATPTAQSTRPNVDRTQPGGYHPPPVHPWATVSPPSPFGPFSAFPGGPRHRASWAGGRPMPPPPHVPHGPWPGPPPPPPPRGGWGAPLVPWGGPRHRHFPGQANPFRDVHAVPDVRPEVPSISNCRPTPSNDTLWAGFNGNSNRGNVDHPRCAPTSDELKAEVERAKADYKARKEAYRQMKEDMRKDQERKRNVSQGSELRLSESASKHLSTDTQASIVRVATDSLTATPERVLSPAHQAVPVPPPGGPVTHIVSNARGQYPQLEMFSVPRHHHHRSHTIGHAGNIRESESDEARAIRRITRKLADMGFTESTHPDLPTKVRAHVPTSGKYNREIEDDIVTTLLEHFLVTAPAASGDGSSSGPRDSGIPGAWH